MNERLVGALDRITEVVASIGGALELVHLSLERLEARAAELERRIDRLRLET